MNRRMMLVFGAIALLAACIILYLALNADNSATADTQAGATSGGSGAADSPARKKPRAGSAEAVADGSGVTILPDGTREYMRGDVKVRDHRKNPTGPHQDVPKREPPPDGRKIAPAITADLNKIFQPVLRECAAGIPTASRGKKPHVDGVMTIAIKDQKATVTETDVALRDVQGDAAITEFKKCLSEKSAGLAAQAPSEADIEKYQITLSLSLPRAPQPKP